jgi:hypothetical protein
MGRGSDLTPAVVQRIVHLARRRLIAGADKYARVCRQWRDASGEEAEQLQLFLDLHFMSAEELARASSWMSVHGRHVNVLVMSAGGAGFEAPPTSCFPTLAAAAPALSRLRRLEVDQDNSLSLLEPVLGQLPQLQHLAADVTMQCDPRDAALQQDVVRGMFQDHQGHPWQELPELQQLCPQLIRLHLRLDSAAGHVEVDERLPRLLPAALKHLALSARRPHHDNMYLHPGSLTHLSALQQLALDGVGVDEEQCEALGALQQLQVYAGDDVMLQPVHMPVARKVTVHTTCSLQLPVAVQLVQLKRLVLVTGSGLNLGTAEAVAALTGLQELSLQGCVSDGAAVEVVEAAAGMAQLRSLQLRGGMVDPDELGALLERCTQLTALDLAVCSIPDFNGDLALAFLAVPQQLTGLRRLTVPVELLAHEERAWLAPLTALTRLCVTMTDAVLPAEQRPFLIGDAEQWRQWLQEALTLQAKVQELLQQVAVWPASLQQVMFWVPNVYPRLEKRVRPSCWQYTPPAPGSTQFDVWFEVGGPSGDASVASSWARPFRPCPHLPGVWELQGECEGMG